jgi:hypothetical protein
MQQNTCDKTVPELIYLFQSYVGEVVHASDDHVVVIFEIDDDIREQTYDIKQFKHKPQKGDMLKASVQFAKLPDNGDKKILNHTRNSAIPLPRTF